MRASRPEQIERNLGESIERSPRGFRIPRIDILFLAVCVFMALAVRLDFMRAVRFAIDGDEAIVGLMGKHILEGKGVPVFYYGQHYMGSLEAIMASLSFFVFGMTPFSLQLVPLLWSIAMVPLVYLVGRSLMNRRVGLVAAVLMALPPPALIVWSSKARGGFIEIVFLGMLALYLAMLWFRDTKGSARYPAAVGFVVGVGWWVNNQIAYAMAAIGIFAFCYLIFAPLVGLISGRKDSRALRRLIVSCAFGPIFFLIGSSPYWIYNIQRGFPSAGMFSLSNYEGFCQHLDGLRFTALPMLLGAKRFWQKGYAFSLARELAWGLYVMPIVGVCLIRWRQWFRLLLGKIDHRQPVELFVLFCVTACFIFALSSYGWLVQAPRYLLPLYPALFILLGVAAQYISGFSSVISNIFVGALVCFHLAAAYVPERAIAGEPVVFAGQRVERDHQPLIEALGRLGIKRIRTNYWIGYRLAFETAEEVTFSMLAEPDQVRIPDYERSDEDRGSLPLVLVESEASIVRPALRKLGYSFTEERAGGYFIFFNLRQEPHPRDLLRREDILRASGSGTQSPDAALDGDLATRWGTGAPQSPGQEFTIIFNPVTRVSEIQYDCGRWRNDLAKSLVIQGELIDGTVQELLSAADFRGSRYLGWGEHRLTVRFPQVALRRLMLRQLGGDPIVDWSIAELRLYRDKGE
jgi:hypothetical protein